MISPLVFFVLLLAGTAGLFIVQRLARRVHQRRLIALAREWRMHYAADDRFDLAPHVAERLALPGAADVQIVDLIYGTDQGTRRYVFCAQFTRGVVRWKRREQCVASLSEKSEVWSSLTVAPAKLTLLEKYQSVADALTPEKKTSS